MYTCLKCNKSFTRQSNLKRHENEACKGDQRADANPNFIKRNENDVTENLTFLSSSDSSKRPKIESTHERLDWGKDETGSDHEGSDDQVSNGDANDSDSEKDLPNIDDIKKDFGLWLKKLGELKDNAKEGKGIGPKYRGGAIPSIPSGSLIDELISIPERLDWQTNDEIDSDNVVTSDDDLKSSNDSTRKDERKNDVTSEDGSLENVIAFEKKELLKILKEFANVVDEEDESKLIDLERLLSKFFISDYERSEVLGPRMETFPKVHAQLNKLTNSKIPKWELSRAKILVNNLDRKRRTLQDIFRGIKNDRDVGETAKILCQERMIPFDVFDKLRKLEKPNLENISAILQSEL